MKRLSRSLITTLLVALLAFAFIGCQTTPKVEALEPVAAPVVEPEAPAPAAAVAAPPMAPVRKAPTAEMVVKSNDRYNEFDLYIAHTNDVLGHIEEDGGIGYAKLASGVKYERSLTDKTLLLDAGNVVSGTPLAEQFEGEVVGVLLDMVGYDAVVPGPADFAYGKDWLIEAARLAQEHNDVKVLSANVLNARGEWVFQPYQLYYYNDFVVAVAGVTAPPADTEGLTFLSHEFIDSAQHTVDVVREKADYVVVLGSIGDVGGITSEVIAKDIMGIDLIVDGKGAKAPAGGKWVGDTLIVNAGEYLESVGLVEVHVKDDAVTSVTPIRITASDVKNPKASALLQWMGVKSVPADAEVQAYIDTMK